jgi:hypothetical protein
MKLVKLRTFQVKTTQNPYILGCSKLRDIKVDINKTSMTCDASFGTSSVSRMQYYFDKNQI